MNDLDRQTLREVLAGCGRRISSWPAWRWSLFLTLGTFGVFFAISFTVRWLASHDFRIDGVPEWLRCPLLFTTCCCGDSPSSWAWPMIGYGLYFCSYHVVAWICTQASNVGIPDWLQGAAVYPMIGGMILAHWQVGLRRWRRGWLLPVGVAIANAVIALTAYVFHWPS